LFGFGTRPIRLDYLVFLWAFVPWWWRHPDPLWFLRPSRWPGIVATFRTGAGRLRDAWQASPTAALSKVHRRTRVRLRAYLGLENSRP
jgi:hypothetical protein